MKHETPLSEKSDTGPIPTHGLSGQNGELARFWDTWEKHRAYLFWICSKHTRDIPEDAEDALSGALLKAAAALPRHNPHKGTLRAWLGSLTRNHCLDLLRAYKRRQGLMSDLAYQRRRPSVLAPETAVSDPLPIARLNHMIEALPRGLNDVVVRRFFGKMSSRDIACELKISPACVRKRIQIARGILRAGIRKGGGWGRRS